MQSILTSPSGKLSPKHLPAATFQFHHLAACCCGRHPSVPFCLLLLILFLHSLRSLSLSHVLFTCPFIRAARDDFFAKIEPNLETWQLSRYTSTHPLVFQLLSPLYGSWQTHFDLKKCMAQNMYPHTGRVHKAHKKMDRQTCRDRRRNAYTWMHRQTLTQPDISTHTNTYTTPQTHTHTTLLFYEVSLCLAGVGGQTE